MYHRFCTLLFVAFVAGGTSSCSEQAAPGRNDGAEVDGAAVRQDFGTGPVKLSIELSADSITTADALTCTMTLRVDDGYEAEFPDLAFPVDLPGMILTHFDEHQAKEEARTLTVCEYELEPEYPGTFELPSLQVYYHRENQIQEEMFETDPIEFKVVETPASAEMLELKPFRGLVTVEQIRAERRRRWPWMVGGIGGAMVLAALVVYVIRRPRPGPPPRPAHEIALEALRALAAKDLVAKGQIEPFFVEITWIIRDYIELAFGLRAPEQTTEEFLGDITTVSAVAKHRNVLETFLTAADEVKFARATPETSTIQRTFDTARDFVLQTSSTAGGGG
jgi:hypothetical protein